MPRPFDPIDPIPLEEQRGQTYVRLVELMQRLLAPDGCPWDREQSYESLRRYVLEEAAEVVDAIDRGDRQDLRDEIGDLLLQAVFLGELARREGAFGPDDVVKAIVDKLVRRHPHVFSDVEVDSASEVLGSWERIKASERKASGKTDHGVLGGIPRTLPALLRAQRLGEKAASVGFDWPDATGPRAKLDEELAELDEALAGGDPDRIEMELGDVLFALVNVARHARVDAEAALRRVNASFVERFAHVEQLVKEHHGGFDRGPIPLETLEAYWQRAKERQSERG
ncbi:MAG TPA: nucleoside triphosphate pyrophosphohydrolase [Polyangiaceae bacterium]|nr:nucleoside triphosphate pyrophosphohydrolase [Polyangiaceae bacterium]